MTKRGTPPRPKSTSNLNPSRRLRETPKLLSSSLIRIKIFNAGPI